MGYLTFDETGGGRTEVAAEPTTYPVADAAAEPQLSALEWSVVALAEHDRLSTLRHPGRVSSAMGRLFGQSPNPRLADPRLEALRRIAVLSWHYGYTIPSVEVRGFIGAGFTPEQYELVVDSIGRARAAASARRHRG